MRKIQIIFMLFAILGSAVSCEDYLDVPREIIELNEEDIFTNYVEYKNYYSAINAKIGGLANHFSYGARNNGWRFAGWPNTATDEMRPYYNYLFEDHWFDVGNFTQFYCATARNHNIDMFWLLAWEAIRIANVTIYNIDMLQDATEQQKNELVGQAHYARAFIYNFMLQVWGGMPYLTKPLDSNDEMNLSRLSYHETIQKIVADCDKAAQLLPPRWDNPDPSSDNYLATEDVGRFTSVHALGLKSRVLLYDASPISNTANDNTRWEVAAAAAYEALSHALQNGYRLVDVNLGEKYTDNFFGHYVTPETIHAITWRTLTYPVSSWEITRTYLPSTLTSPPHNHGLAVTHDLVERFEAVQRDASGNIIKALPVDEAAQEGFFNPQDPFNPMTRDPRFYTSIIYHGRPVIRPARTLNMSEGSADLRQTNGYNNKTGYYIGKFWNGGTNVPGGNNINTPMPINLMRLAELYLNFAEAANEAYGPSNAAAGMSASAAIAALRARVGMPPVDARYATKEQFRERIRNERAVELCFESNHRFADTRRWKIINTPDYRTTHRIRITPDITNDLAAYPTGFVFEKVFLEERPYDERLYFYPVPQYDVDNAPNFKQNPGY